MDEELYQVILFDNDVGYYLFVGTYLTGSEIAVSDIKRAIGHLREKSNCYSYSKVEQGSEDHQDRGALGDQPMETYKILIIRIHTALNEEGKEEKIYSLKLNDVWVGQLNQEVLKTTMTEIPDEFELMSFFEVEPKKLDLDPNIPFYYTSLTYTVTRDSERIEIHLSPAYGDMEIFWEQEHQLRFNWRFYNIKSIHIEKKDGSEYLILKSNAENITDCYLWVKPHFKIIGGMSITE